MVVTCWYIVEALIISNGVPVTSIAVYCKSFNMNIVMKLLNLCFCHSVYFMMG